MSKTAGPKGISQRVASQTQGGFLDDTDAVIADVEYMVDRFDVDRDGEKETVERTAARVEFEVEGRDETVDMTYSIGGAVSPSEDGESESETGQYLVGKDGKEFKGISKDSGWGKFLSSLVIKCKFPDENLDHGPRAALVGLKVHLNSVEGGKFKGKQGRPIPVPTKLDKATIPNPEKAVTVTKGSKNAGAKKKAAKEVEEPEDDAIESVVTDAVQKAVAKGAVAKAKLSTLVKKALEKAGIDEDDVVEGVKLALSTAFLKEGVKDGLWSFDGREVGPADEDDDDAEEDE